MGDYGDGCNKSYFRCVCVRVCEVGFCRKGVFIFSN